ncbi:unnamed protein product [Effrenium voratum]|nr:unnamed protein product [Effrenium voratum]
MRLLRDRSATLELAGAIEQAGAAALCIHGRTLEQRPKYAKSRKEDLAPDWDAIAEIRKVLNIPVIANGGIETRQDAVRCQELTGCAAVMSAEALLESPDLFAEEHMEEPAIPRLLRLSREFLDLAQAFPCALKYPPTKSHLFKLLHRLLGEDQAEARRAQAAGQSLTKRQELKLALMGCPVHDFEAIRRTLDLIEQQSSESLLGSSWYRRWREPGSNTRARETFCRCGLEFCSEACFVSAWHMEHQFSCPKADEIKEATALSRTRPEARAELGAALLGMRRHFRCGPFNWAAFSCLPGAQAKPLASDEGVGSGAWLLGLEPEPTCHELMGRLVGKREQGCPDGVAKWSRCI